MSMIERHMYCHGKDQKTPDHMDKRNKHSCIPIMTKKQVDLFLSDERDEKIQIFLSR